MTLRARTVLQLSDFQIHVEKDSLYLSNERYSFIPCSTDILKLLHLFSKPRTLADAAAQPSLAHDWVKQTQSILSLLDAGILEARDGESGSPAVGLDQVGFGGAREHITMLNDRTRTSVYLDAVRNIVKPGDVVVDLGAGTGILAAAAARCGAGMVHAIERTPIADAAAALIRANGLDDHVRIHRDVSTNVVLNDPADVLISELVGNEPLSERVLEYVLDARRRLLKPDARILPSALALMGQCIQLPPGLVDEYRFTGKNTTEWSRAYGLDFSALQNLRVARPLSVDIPARRLNQGTALGDKVSIHAIDFADFSSARVAAAADLPITRAGTVDAVHVSFTLTLDDERTIRNGYREVDETTSWGCRIWVPHEPIPVKPGDALWVGYRHNPFGSQLEFL